MAHMDESSFCNYQGLVGNTIPSQTTQFGARPSMDNLGDVYQSQMKGGAGYYLEQIAAGIPISMMDNAAMSSNHDSMLVARMLNQVAVTGAYEFGINYALKMENKLPPTPPGSPEDANSALGVSGQQYGYHNTMHPASMVGIPSSFNFNLLSMPMRRMSEKRISQTCLSSSNMSTYQESCAMVQEPLAEPSALIDPAANTTLARAFMSVQQQTSKCARSEKKPIPSEQKNDTYFERRKRNNSAAKKSRDARKARVDEITIRASYLEKENAMIRKNISCYQDEIVTLKKLLAQKHST